MRSVRQDKLSLTGEFFSVSDEFSAYIEEYDQGMVHRIRFEWVGSALTFEDALALMKWNVTFLDFLTSLLTNCEMDGFVWELPPVSASTLNRPFEFVLIDTGQPYHRAADPSDFEVHLKPLAGREEIAKFKNLSGDAILVVPSVIDGADYRDFLHFLQTAETSHIQGLWKALAGAVTEALTEQPLWISVSGAGVAWLHIRLDTQPKYYLFSAFRTFAA